MEDSLAALQLARYARKSRAELRRRIAAGYVDPIEVLEYSHRLPDVFRIIPHYRHPAYNMRVQDFLTAIPAIGIKKAQGILESLQINERKRLGALGSVQRSNLESVIRSRQKPFMPAEFVVLSGPTAVGKGTIGEYVKNNFKQISIAISATTRPPRLGEINGQNYYFLSRVEFDNRVRAGDFLEYATVHGVHSYGTLCSEVDRARSSGKCVLLEIDIQGARQLKNTLPGARFIFLLPPSWNELCSRLFKRGTEDLQEQERRMQTARVELAAIDEFDTFVINEDVASASSALVRKIGLV